MAEHSTYLREGISEVQTRSILQEEEALAEILAGSPVQGARCLWRSTKTGSWLKMQPSTEKCTELGAQEWKDSLFLRYGLHLPDLPK